MSDGAVGTELARLTVELDKLARYADEQERKATQLEQALESRVVIERAVGVLAERFTLSFEEAFDLLRRAARDSRAELRGIAAELLKTRTTPAAISAALDLA